MSRAVNLVLTRCQLLRLPAPRCIMARAHHTVCTQLQTFGMHEPGTAISQATARPPSAGVNTFFGRAAALISATNNVANIAKVMTKIGAICLVTIGVWIVIQLGVQFGLYRHHCSIGEGAHRFRPGMDRSGRCAPRCGSGCERQTVAFDSFSIR